MEVDVRRRIQTGANGWSNVGGGGGDDGQKDFQKTEGESHGFLCSAS